MMWADPVTSVGSIIEYVECGPLENNDLMCRNNRACEIFLSDKFLLFGGGWLALPVAILAQVPLVQGGPN